MIFFLIETPSCGNTGFGRSQRHWTFKKHQGPTRMTWTLKNETEWKLKIAKVDMVTLECVLSLFCWKFSLMHPIISLLFSAFKYNLANLELKNLLYFIYGYMADIQLFRERLWEKVHTTIPKGIVGGFEFTVLQKIWKNGTVRRGHRRMFANANWKHQ